MRGVTVKRLLRLVYGVTQGQPQVAYAPGCTRRMIPECTRRVLKNAKNVRANQPVEAVGRNGSELSE